MTSIPTAEERWHWLLRLLRLTESSRKDLDRCTINAIDARLLGLRVVALRAQCPGAWDVLHAAYKCGAKARRTGSGQRTPSRHYINLTLEALRQAEIIARGAVSDAGREAHVDLSETIGVGRWTIREARRG